MRIIFKKNLNSFQDDVSAVRSLVWCTGNANYNLQLCEEPSLWRAAMYLFCPTLEKRYHGSCRVGSSEEEV